MTIDISGKDVDEMLNEKVLGKKLHSSTAAHKPTSVGGRRSSRESLCFDLAHVIFLSLYARTDITTSEERIGVMKCAK